MMSKKAEDIFVGKMWFYGTQSHFISSPSNLLFLSISLYFVVFFLFIIFFFEVCLLFIGWLEIDFR